MQKIKDRSLYLVISESCALGKSAEEIAKAAIAGGVDMIQMREKDKPKTDLVRLGRRLSALCRASGCIFIVNDDPILAAEVGADGVHLGQEDIKSFTIGRARDILGPDKIIGISTDTISKAKGANNEDIEYIGFGPVFPTALKDKCVGTKDVQEVLKISKKPVFFIGGITLNNVGELLAKGAKAVAVIRAILESDDITLEVKKWKNCLNSARSIPNSSTR